MFRYEIKKIFSDKGNRIALLILFFTMIAASFMLIHGIQYIDEKGGSRHGLSAVKKLKEEKIKWEGEVDEELLTRVIDENTRINGGADVRTQSLEEQNINFSQKQGFDDIRQLINYAFSGGFREYDYHTVDTVDENEVGSLYEKRVNNLSDWLDTEGRDTFSQRERDYLIARYKDLRTPFFYTYFDGWKYFFEYLGTIISAVALIVGFLVANIFPAEFRSKADSIFFSSYHGRGKAVRSKIFSGYFIATTVYWISLLLYGGILFAVFGFSGAHCPLQLEFWKSFFNITFLQGALLCVTGGYVGSMFIASLTMWVSAKSKSRTIGALIPFLLILIPSFLNNISALEKILGVFPNRLLEINRILQSFNLYSLGGSVHSPLPILFGLYIPLSVVLCFCICSVYKKITVY